MSIIIAVVTLSKATTDFKPLWRWRTGLSGSPNDYPIFCFKPSHSYGTYKPTTSTCSSITGWGGPTSISPGAMNFHQCPKSDLLIKSVAQKRKSHTIFFAPAFTVLGTLPLSPLGSIGRPFQDILHVSLNNKMGFAHWWGKSLKQGQTPSPRLPGVSKSPTSTCLASNHPSWASNVSLHRTHLSLASRLVVTLKSQYNRFKENLTCYIFETSQ